jgi:heavy metal translocating P-type ATPase
VDRFSRVYTPAVVGAAVVLAVVPPLLGGDFGEWFYRSLALLIIACPCALVISTPVTVVSGIGAASRRGILIKGGEALEAAGRLKALAFDKTGTLTEGRPAVRQIVPVASSEQELLTLAAAVEAGSEHPLARAVVEEAFNRGLAPGEVQGFEAVPGKGVRARLGGTRLIVGSPAFLQSEGVDVEAHRERIHQLESQGQTVIGVARDGVFLGLLALGDALRPDAADAVSRLHALGIRTSLITGDNEQAARHFARAAGIEDVHARVLPAEKANMVRKLQENARVAMVGDGINDAPALMQADVGIAFGSGADIAIESADVIILNKRVGAVLDAYEVSRSSYRKIVQNVTLAFLFNGLGIPAAATGLVYPIWGMVAMAASVTSIFINSLWGRGAYFFQAIQTVGHAPQVASGAQAEADDQIRRFVRSADSLTGDSGHV